MTATLVPPATAQAHRDPNVLRWLGAYTASMLGDSVYYLALSWAAVQAGTPAQAGLVMSASAVPRAVLMLGGGVIADRLGPRRVVIGSDAVRCGAVLAVALLLFLTSPGLWPLALLAVVFGAVDAVFMPAVGALPARITGKDQLARVQGMRGLAIRCAGVVGAPSAASAWRSAAPRPPSPWPARSSPSRCRCWSRYAYGTCRATAPPRCPDPLERPR